MQGFIISLILMGISALAYIAYKHHKGFEKIAMVLMLLSAIAVIGVIIWNSAINIALITAMHTGNFQDSDNVRQAIKELLVPQGPMLIISFSWMAYLTILIYLPYILCLGIRDDDESQVEK